jgi:hypothetical protein
MANNDEIENLFRNLPKSPEFSEIERKRQEKLIRSYVGDMAKEEGLKQNSPLKRFQSQFSLAAGFIVLVAGVSFALSQGIFESKDDVVISMPTPDVKSPSSEETDNQGQENSEQIESPKPKNPTIPNQGELTELESGSANQSDLERFINSTNLDYSSDVKKIKSIVKLSASPLSISNLPLPYGKCAIELGINKELLGIDKAKYDGINVLAYYFGSSKTNASIWIVDKSCKKIIEIM